jgi:PAS domain S-box-containing protein
MENLTGQPRANVLGKGIDEFISAEQHPEQLQVLHRALRGEKVLLYEQDGPLGAPQGIYEFMLVPLSEQGQPAVSVLGIVRDVTDRRKREEERTQVRLLQQREVLNAVVQTQEQERERIAESLHNGLAQLLFAIKLNLQSYLSGSDQAEPKNPGLLSKIDSLLKEAILQSRLISEDLTPSILRDFGLIAALEDWINLLSTPSLRITCQSVGLEKRLQTDLELTIFRIVQALIGNALLHAGASQVQVLVARKTRSVTIVVEDNGKGLSKEELNKQIKGIGLRSVKNRAALLNGRVSVDSKSGKGTVISVYLPMSR